ncbi:hypothetical protein [Marinicellulosiphila megalodicopiae]|uniref:hypothetical protein n=1 Tax=Marinicellulosiphila megalodicopiae TaxID=2724896 RepID=UPI003BAFB034
MNSKRSNTFTHAYIQLNEALFFTWSLKEFSNLQKKRIHYQTLLVQVDQFDALQSVLNIARHLHLGKSIQVHTQCHHIIVKTKHVASQYLQENP